MITKSKKVETNLLNVCTLNSINMVTNKFVSANSCILVRDIEGGARELV